MVGENTPTVVVAAYNRPRSLSRLLRSLELADIPPTARLAISIDGGGDGDCVDLAEGFDWHGGDKVVITHPHNLGLRRHLLSCGDLSQDYGSVIVLEDDLVVSPAFYDYASRTIAHYRTDDRVAGVSLYSQRFNETAYCVFEPLHNGYSAFMARLPASWGQAYTASQWSRFRAWLGDNPSPVFDSLPTNIQAWPKSSWKKLMAAYMAETDRWFVYPYFGFSTDFGDAGVHVFESPNLHQAELATSVRTLNLPTVENAVKYDLWWELIDQDVEWDVYGTKTRITSERVLSSRPIPGYRRTQGFGVELRPIQMNFFLANEGDAFWMNVRQGGVGSESPVPAAETRRRLSFARTDWIPLKWLLAVSASRIPRRLRRISRR